MAETIKCPACGRPNPSGAVKCTNCGTALVSTVTARPVPSRNGRAGPASPPNQPTPPSQPARRNAPSAAPGAATPAGARQGTGPRPAPSRSAGGSGAIRAAGVRPTAVPRTGAPGTRRSSLPPGPVSVTGALTGALDRTGLARFSTGRYLVIWSVFAIVFLGAILFLIYSGQAKPAALPKYMVVETTKGTFKVQLYTDPADKVVDVVRNFADKARAGTFNGRTFHRVEDWVIQGGDPLGTGLGGGSITAEYNQKPFVRGAVGVASTAGGGGQINDSQWFVVKTDALYLNGQYSNFGQVVEGMDVVDKIVIGDKMTKVTVADQ